jgi:hypothetical protein
MRALKIAVVAAAFGAAAMFPGSASNAMPVGGLVAASNELASDVVQDVRWCGRYRCRGYPRPYYAYRPYYVYSPYYAYYGWPYYRPYWGFGWGWGAWWW